MLSITFDFLPYTIIERFHTFITDKVPSLLRIVSLFSLKWTNHLTSVNAVWRSLHHWLKEWVIFFILLYFGNFLKKNRRYSPRATRKSPNCVATNQAFQRYCNSLQRYIWPEQTELHYTLWQGLSCIAIYKYYLLLI